MAICPDCAREFYVEGEDDLEIGDIVYCEECGAELEVSKLNELELKPVDDDEEDDEDFDDEEDLDDEDDEDLDDDEDDEDSFDDDFDDEDDDEVSDDDDR